MADKMQDFVLLDPDDVLLTQITQIDNADFIHRYPTADAVWINDERNPLGPIIVIVDFGSYFLLHIYDNGEEIGEIREMHAATPDTICLAWASMMKKLN